MGRYYSRHNMLDSSADAIMSRYQSRHFMVITIAKAIWVDSRADTSWLIVG